MVAPQTQLLPALVALFQLRASLSPERAREEEAETVAELAGGAARFAAVTLPDLAPEEVALLPHKVLCTRAHSPLAVVLRAAPALRSQLQLLALHRARALCAAWRAQVRVHNEARESFFALMVCGSLPATHHFCCEPWSMCLLIPGRVPWSVACSYGVSFPSLTPVAQLVLLWLEQFAPLCAQFLQQAQAHAVVRSHSCSAVATSFTWDGSQPGTAESSSDSGAHASRSRSRTSQSDGQSSDVASPCGTEAGDSDCQNHASARALSVLPAGRLRCSDSASSLHVRWAVQATCLPSFVGQTQPATALHFTYSRPHLRRGHS